MSQIPSELKYVSTHEWIRTEDDGTVTIGITDHAQELLGDVVYVEVPEEETSLASGEEAGVVESVKAASDIYSPLSGDVVEVNTALADAPELVNQDPYGAGWIFRLRPTDPDELEDLMDAEAYAELCEEEE
ncbi:glycine cleavage system protein H [Pokkaliibacter plantistimulans]|uniref:Glycine cleavage system H protein n=2 Tax=Pseudomonadota TaxID=1224 RepID=A0ABX5M2F0_9GAMM|nr:MULTISPECIES: glycine cleavage system protein GcvH [Pokkaliibacter]MDH2432293.1 glycine cleavage system protein GcvH [Pokkaliibacter sp. MBI-7]PPC75279.1 glycine cleavage system protein H [Pokkaliibacter plantistimulans]PXF33085.1 glycine cleavage system protein H [Pokkaliibacter plantistimulans]